MMLERPGYDPHPSPLPRGEGTARAFEAGWLFAAALVCLGWAARLLAYGTEELGLDGHLSVGLALLPVPRLLGFLARDVHPPLFYLTLKAWLALVGVDYLSARWIGVAAGTLTLAMLYRFIRSLAGPRGALIASALLVLSPATISASATVRDFGLGLLLSVASLVAWRALDGNLSRRRRWLGLAALALSTALALAAWYFHALFVVGQFVALALNPKDWRARASALAIGSVVQLPWAVVAAGPLVAKVGQGVTVSGQRPAPASLQAVLADLGTVFAGALPTTIGHVVPAVTWLVLVGVGIAWADAVGGPRRGWAFLALFGLSLGLLVVYGLASRWAGATLLGRYGLVLLPWAALAQAWAFGGNPLAAPREDNSPIGLRTAPIRANGRVPRAAGSGGATKRARQRASVAAQSATPSNTATLLLGLVLVGIVLLGQAADFLSLERLEGFPWERRISSAPELDLLQREARRDDLIVYTDLARAGQYALRGGGPATTATVHVAGSAFLRDDASQAAAILNPRLANRSRVWLLYDRPLNLASLGSIADSISQQRFLTRETTFGNAVVDLYEQGPALDRHAGPVRFGSAIVLADWAISPAALAGETVFVDLHWQATAPVGANYTVFVHLVDGNGQKIAQHDAEPAFGSRPTASWRPGETIDDRIALVVPALARPGTYHVLVGLYRGSERLPVAAGRDSFDLGEVQLTPR
jgi:hypothetical protein